MRRNTLLVQNNVPSLFKNKRHCTLLSTNPINIIQQQSLSSITNLSKHNYMISQFIVKDVLQQLLTSKLQSQLNNKQLKLIINNTMEQCTKLFQNQNWQIDPNGPFKQLIKQQNHIILDSQPQIRHYDPLLGFNKGRIYNNKKLSTQQSQSSISLSRFKIHSQSNSYNQSNQKHKLNHNNKSNKSKQHHKSSFLNINNLLSKKSIKSNQSLLQNNQQITPRLIPLKLFQQSTNLINNKQSTNSIKKQSTNSINKIDQFSSSSLSISRRSLQDFLRQKKINDQINLGYKIKFISNDQQFNKQHKQNYLKTIKQFPKSTYFLKTIKNINQSLQFNNQFIIKLPQISHKQNYITDYNGQGILLQKQSKLKKSNQILKTTFKIKPPSTQQINKIKYLKQNIKFQKINHPRPVTLRDQSINLGLLSARLNTENDMKTLLEQNFYTNRVKFRNLKYSTGNITAEQNINSK